MPILVKEKMGFKVILLNHKDRLLTPSLTSLIKKEVEEFVKRMNPPDTYLFQWYFTSDSVLKIVEYMIGEFDVEGCNVACLMTPSIGLALSKTKYAKKNDGVYVFDIDENIVEELESRKVHAVQYDIAEPVPENYRGYFDCVIMDPPYDEDYYFASLSRAIELVGGKQYKTMYIVVPPPEIAYLRKLGFPPIITQVLLLLERCGLLFENISKGICTYVAPPFEVAALSECLGRKPEEMLRNWGSSDLLKVSVFRDVTSPLPSRIELPLETREKYERYKRRFLIRSAEIKNFKEFPYTIPKSVPSNNASEWDEFKEEFTGRFSSPYFVFIYDIGDWDDPANRLIKLEGAVAHYLWQKLKGYDTLNTDAICSLSHEIKKEFSNTPELNQIKKHIKDFVQELEKLKLISSMGKQ